MTTGQQARGALPVRVSQSLLWTGGCADVTYQGHVVHSHMGSFLVLGSERTLLVDTGHPAHRASVVDSILAALDGRPLDYVFPTHSEYPRAGLLGQWLERFPPLRGRRGHP